MQEKVELKKIKCGKNTRFSFSKLDEILPVPNLLEIQKGAYKEFLETGIKRVLDEFSPISDYSGKAKLYLLDADLSTPPKYSIKEWETEISPETICL